MAPPTTRLESRRRDANRNAYRAVATHVPFDFARHKRLKRQAREATDRAKKEAANRRVMEEAANERDLDKPMGERGTQ